MVAKKEVARRARGMRLPAARVPVGMGKGVPALVPLPFGPRVGGGDMPSRSLPPGLPA